MTPSSAQLLNECDEMLNAVESRKDLDSTYLQTLRKAVENGRKYRWAFKEIKKLHEEIESL